jgi:hypothetical protein
MGTGVGPAALCSRCPLRLRSAECLGHSQFWSTNDVVSSFGTVLSIQDVIRFIGIFVLL